MLHELVEYAKCHFGHEEQAFDETRYAEADRHKAEHDKLATQVIELEQNLRSGEVVLSMDVLTFLKDWLQNHILKADKAYSRHLTAHGVRQTDSPDAHNDRDVA